MIFLFIPQEESNDPSVNSRKLKHEAKEIIAAFIAIISNSLPPVIILLSLSCTPWLHIKSHNNGYFHFAYTGIDYISEAKKAQ